MPPTPSRRGFVRYASALFTASLGGCASSRTTSPSPNVDGWPAFGRDASNAAYNPTAAGPSNGERDWFAKTNGAPVVTDDNLYHVRTAKRGASLVVRSPDTGERRTRVSLPLPGTNVPPTVTDDAAYITGSTGMVAVDLEDRSVRWRVGQEEGVSDVRGATAVVDGVAYVCNSGFGQGTAALYAFDPDSGERQWRRPVFDRVQTTPAVADGTVWAGTTGGSLFAIDAVDGSVRWTFDTGDPIRVSPVVTENSVYVRDASGTLYSLRVADGRKRWIYADSELAGEAFAVDSGTVYTGDATGLRAIDASDGTKVWHFTTPGGNGGPDAIAVADETLFVGGGLGHVFSLVSETGRENWRFRSGLNGRSDKATRSVGGLAVASNALYVGAADGLHAFRGGG